MHYAFHCLDRTGAGEVGRANREAHLAHLRSVGDRILVAGPLLDADERAMVGSLLVIDFDDRASAEAFARSDPYAVAGLFETVTITAWKKVLPGA